jgi:hypothetical protein
LPTATASEPRRSWRRAGTTSTSPPGACMCAGPRAGMPACIQYQPCGREIRLSHSFPHAAARLRVQARQRRPRHSRHSGLSRPPIDHVHRALYGFDTPSVQEFLEGLTPSSRPQPRSRPSLLRCSIVRRRRGCLTNCRHECCCCERDIGLARQPRPIRVRGTLC